jgi:CO/xanthine dehydrogenase FAD-binding subunit
MTTRRAVKQPLPMKRIQSMLHAATRFIGHPPIRNRGNVVGALEREARHARRAWQKR